MRQFTQIATARLLLRRFSPSDLPAFLRYRNDPVIARYQTWEYTEERDARAMFDDLRYAEPGRPEQPFQFAIARGDTDELIGDCYFTLLYDDCRQGEIGYTLSRTAQGHGYMREAVTAVLSFAFGTLELHRVIARTACANTPSVRLLERIGMRQEGILRQSYWCKGEWIDEYLYAILADEWNTRQLTTRTP